MIEESKERPVTDFEKDMAIFLAVSTGIGVVEDDRQDQRHAENVFVKTPRRLSVPAAQADMIDMLSKATNFHGLRTWLPGCRHRSRQRSSRRSSSTR